MSTCYTWTIPEEITGTPEDARIARYEFDVLKCAGDLICSASGAGGFGQRHCIMMLQFLRARIADWREGIKAMERADGAVKALCEEAVQTWAKRNRFDISCLPRPRKAYKLTDGSLLRSKPLPMPPPLSSSVTIYFGVCECGKRYEYWNRRTPENVVLKGVKFPEGTYHLENQKAFMHGGDGHHVLRLIANQQITAAKGAEWIREILMGEKPDLPPFTVGAPELG